MGSTFAAAGMSPANSDENMRDHARVRVGLAASLFDADERVHACTVMDISPGGARIACDCVLPVESCVVLYVEGIGRFNAFVIRSGDGETGLFFVCHDERRLDVQEQLARLMEGGAQAPTRLRRHARQAANAFGYFARANGQLVQCHVLDISLHGLSVQTPTRPPIGEILDLGGAQGRVTRHHDGGIGIQFLRPVTCAQATGGA
jgi:hypothetical protein